MLHAAARRHPILRALLSARRKPILKIVDFVERNLLAVMPRTISGCMTWRGTYGSGSKTALSIVMPGLLRVRRVSVRTGQRYRLLTEAEWEYAARAGTTTPYSFGHTIDQKQANFLGRGSVGRTQPVGSYPRNGWGLHDMHGNVFEWVEDCYRESYEGLTGDASQAVNQANCDVKSAFMRVMRGGCWGCDSGRLRSETRNASVPSSRSSLIGFRVARTPGS